MLKNQVVIVTGGAGLLGQEFVRAVVVQGGTAVIADVNEELSLSVKKNLSVKLNSKNIDYIQLDITSKISINNAINQLSERYGRIDALVNNAYPRNKSYGKSFFEVEYDGFVQNIGVNLGGYFLTSQCFAKYFSKEGGGNIINISSVYGVVAPKFEIYENTAMTMPVEYAAIKAGLIHLTKYMAKYFKGLNIRVNTLSLGGVLDGQPDSFINAYKDKCISKGMLDSSDLNGTLIYLLSDMSRCLNGQNIIVDDGFTL